MKRPILLISIFFVAIFVGTAANAQRNTPLSLIEIEGRGFLISVETPEGLHRFQLPQRFVSKPRYTSSDGVALNAPRPNIYSGRQISPGNSSVVSAYKIRDKIKVFFFGRRSGRIYRLSFRLRDDIHSGHLTFQRKHRTRACHLGDNKLAARNNKATLAAFVADRVTVSSDADFDFYLIYGDETYAEIEGILSVASDIYLDQLGFNIIPVEIRAQTSAIRDPYESRLVDDLLEEFRSTVRRQKRLLPANVYHLFTGKSLTPNGVVGLAYLGTLCSSRDAYSFGLTAHVNSAIQPIITAHEIGHNLDATHTSQGIMQASLSSNPREFSEFSLEQMQAYIEGNGDCLVGTDPIAPLQVREEGRDRLKLVYGVAGIEDEDSCSVEVFTSQRRRKLSASKLVLGSLNSTHQVDVTGATLLRANIALRRKQSEREKAFVRSRLTCDEVTAYSDIQRVSGFQSRRQILRRIRSALRRN